MKTGQTQCQLSDDRRILLLQFLMGLSAALANIANPRLAMVTIPVMGRNHFFALFSVVGNLTLGLAPILWGLIIDDVGETAANWHSFEWNWFSVFFVLVDLVFLKGSPIKDNFESGESFLKNRS